MRHETNYILHTLPGRCDEFMDFTALQNYKTLYNVKDDFLSTTDYKINVFTSKKQFYRQVFSHGQFDPIRCSKCW